MALSLFSAVYLDDTSALTVLLNDTETDVDETLVSGMTALHIAAERGFAGMVGVLLGCHANPNATDDLGYTPLMNAVGASDMGHVSVVHRLLSAGCDFNIANHNGMTALHLAASLGHNDIVLMLLNSGADVSVRNNVGESALDLCVQRGLVETVRLLLQKSMKDINVMERYTDNSPTLLQRALSSGQVCICRMLVEAGYRIHSELYLINQFRNNSSDLDSNTEMLEWLAEQLKITHSLQQVCRVYIRRYVSPYISTNVTELGLPTKLQAYVCLQDL